MSVADEPDLVFNVVWTGTAFTYLRYFVASQIAQSQARFRFVVNGCPPEQVALMEQMARRHPDQVVEVLEVAEEMGAHGVALEAVRTQRDDGELFGLIDPDIKANAPFVPELAALLEGPCVAVSSATEVWSDTNVVPPGHPGVAGEHFFGEDGFVFGGPHLTLYRRDALDETCERWGVHLGSAGPELSEAAQHRLADLLGRRFIVFDTGKIVNALLQADGGTVVHQDLPQIVHIGGMSHYLAPADLHHRRRRHRAAALGERPDRARSLPGHPLHRRAPPRAAATATRSPRCPRASGPPWRPRCWSCAMR